MHHHGVLDCGDIRDLLRSAVGLCESQDLECHEGIQEHDPGDVPCCHPVRLERQRIHRRSSAAQHGDLGLRQTLDHHARVDFLPAPRIRQT